jgi:signal transduction histidine kinase
VDDDLTSRLTLSIALKQQGHTVATAENGRQALAMLRQQAFDLVLLDIVMPELHGHHVLAELKSDAALSEIPVIVISGLELMESVIACIKLGAEDHLSKPYDPVLLEARISASLQKKRFRDRELEYLRQVSRITDAAAALERQRFELGSMDDIRARPDALGALARIFERMAAEVGSREQRLAEDNRVQAAFIDVISHELRSPFASVALSVELLRKYTERGMVDQLPDQIERLNHALTQGRRLIDTILSFARHTSGSAALNVERADFAQLVRKVAAPLEREAAEAGLRLEYDLNPALPAVLLDRVRMGEAVFHLVQNAVKFTPAGGTVVLRSQAADDYVLFEVIDNGVGIPADELPMVWEAFSQRSDRLRRGVEGLGLGLALVKATVQAHRGNVMAESQPGRGSSFGFALPVADLAACQPERVH